MSKIRVIASNFLDTKSSVEFENTHFKYALKKSPDDFKTIGLKQIKTLNYEKPTGHTRAVRQRGLFGMLTNVFSALKFMKTGKQIEFNVHFKDGKYIAGVTGREHYFEIQNSWLEVK